MGSSQSFCFLYLHVYVGDGKCPKANFLELTHQGRQEPRAKKARAWKKEKESWDWMPIP